MKIVSIIQEYPPNIVGGLGTYGNGIYPAMTNLGHEVSVITFNSEDSSLPNREVINGVKVYRTPTTKTPEVFSSFFSDEWKNWGGGTDYIEKVLLNNILGAVHFTDKNKRNSEYDIVVANDWLGAIAGMWIKENTDLPVVFHIHSDEYGRSLGRPFGPIAEIERKLANAADRIVTVSYPMAQHLINLGFNTGKIRVCWNGIDVNKYDPAKVTQSERDRLRKMYGIKPDDKMLFFVGRLAEAKGAVELVQAMALIKDPKVKLVILGQGDQEGIINGLISNLGLGEKVKTNFNFVPEEERIRHYAACDLAIFPSKYEPFGIVALEAMAMEKPVVVGASGINGFKEIVVPSGEYQTGCHVNGENPADIYEWGIKPCLVLSDEGRSRLGKNGRQRTIDYFTWDRIARQTIEIYDQVIN